MSLAPSEIVADPTLLLHQVDPAGRQMIFRRTSEELVRDAAFIDGRTDIWAGPPIELPFAAIEHVAAPPALPRRYIFHVSFCGSTLLARLLDRPGKTLALKEPNCLVDLANWRTALVAANALDPDFERLLRLAAALLARPWNADEQIVAKPSSWANNLIADLLAGADSRGVFVTIARDRFLEAVLRGGRDRLAFTARLAAHLSSFVDGGGALLEEAIRSTDHPVGKAARLALVTHHLELRLFEQPLARGSHGVGPVDFAELENDPVGAASRAVEILGLDLDRSDLEANCARWTRENAKADAAYSAERRRSENEEVRAHFGALFDEGLQWAGRTLGTGMQAKA